MFKSIKLFIGGNGYVWQPDFKHLKTIAELFAKSKPLNRSTHIILSSGDYFVSVCKLPPDNSRKPIT